MNQAKRYLEHQGCPTLEALVNEGRSARSSLCIELDALNSILRVLEPLDQKARERCLAAARCVFNMQAAQDALATLEEQDASWRGCG